MARSLARTKVKIKSLLTCHGLEIPSGWGRRTLEYLTGLAKILKAGLSDTLASLLGELIPKPVTGA